MANSKSWLRFGIGNLLLAVALVALGLGWWLDHRHLRSQVELLEYRLENVRLSTGGGRGGGFGGMAIKPRDFESAAEFVQFVELAKNEWVEPEHARAFSQTEHAADAIPGLVTLLHRDDPKLRRRIACVLQQFDKRSEAVVEALIECLDDEDDVVQHHAVQGLAKQRAKSALRALHRKLLDDDCKVAFNVATVITILDPDADIGPRLIELTKSKYRENRLGAIHELPNYVEASTAKKVLNEAFKESDPADQEMRRLIADTVNRLVIVPEP